MSERPMPAQKTRDPFDRAAHGLTFLGQVAQRGADEDAEELIGGSDRNGSEIHEASDVSALLTARGRRVNEDVRGGSFGGRTP